MSRGLPNNVVTGQNLVPVLNKYLGERISVMTMYGAVGDGVTSDKAAFQNAVNDLLAAGGGAITIPGGYTFNLEDGLDIPAGTTPIAFVGDGDGSQLLRTSDCAVGKGFLNVSGSNVLFENLSCELNVNVTISIPAPAGGYGLNYNTDFSLDPLHPRLTKNTCFWLHDGCDKVTLRKVKIQHTGGYAFLANAVNADITNLLLEDVSLENCRPHLFGIDNADLSYGSWTGGILLHGNGLTTNAMVRGCRIVRPRFHRVNGNCCWQHLYGFSSYHQDIHIIDPWGLDLGLDFILMGGVHGWSWSNPIVRRVGYICLGDASPGIPKRLNGLWGTALDHGFCESGTGTGGTVTSSNGEYMDCDGMGHATFNGTVCRHPETTDAEYAEDSIASLGWNALGLTIGNSQASPHKDNISVKVDLTNMSGGAIRVYGTPNCLLSGCNIDHPNDAVEAPVVLGNLSTIHATGIVVGKCRVRYDPATPAPVIREDGSIAAFVSTDKNWIFDNTIISPSGTAYEFKKDANSGSTTQVTHSSSRAGLLSVSTHDALRVGVGSDSSSALQWLHREGASAEVHMQLQGYRFPAIREPLLNVSKAGATHTGVLAVGRFNQAPLGAMSMVEKAYISAFSVWQDIDFLDTEADIFDGTYALLRWDHTLAKWRQSTAVSAGHRVWSDFATDTLWQTLTGPVLAPLSGSVIGIVTNAGGAFQAIAGSDLTKIAFLTSNSTFLVDYNGNLSIAGAGFINQYSNASSTNAKLNFRRAQGTPIAPTAVVDPDYISEIGFWGYDGAAYVEGAMIRALVDGTVSSGVVPVDLQFFAGDLSSARMQIFASNGLVLITGTNAIASLYVNHGYIQSKEGFNSEGTAWNSIQVPAGGFYGLAFYPKSQATHPTDPGAAAISGFGHKAGSQFWYYDPTAVAWATVDFASVGTAGVSSLNALTGSLSIVGGTGVTVTPSGANITVAIGQDVATSASPTFAAVTANGVFQSLPASSGTTALQVHRSGTDYFLVDGAGNVSAVGNVNILGRYTFATSSTPLAGFRYSGGVLQWSNDLSTWNNFSSGGTGVTSLNSLTGALSIAGGTGISVGAAGSTVTVTNTGVTTFNTKAGDITIASGSGVLLFNISGSSFQIVNTGVLSLQGATGPVLLVQGTGISISGLTISNSGVTSLAGGTGISVNVGTGAVTVTNTGVTSIGGHTGAIGLVAGTGVTAFAYVPALAGILVSIGQDVSSTANVNFTSLLIGGSTVINSGGAFIGNGVDVGRFHGVGGRGFNPYDGGGTNFNGQDATISFNPITGRLTVGGVDHDLKFVGGVFVGGI